MYCEFGTDGESVPICGEDAQSGVQFDGEATIMLCKEHSLFAIDALTQICEMVDS